MNKELMEALDILEKEKEISKETLFEAIENSLLTACKNHFGKADNVKVVRAERAIAIREYCASSDYNGVKVTEGVITAMVEKDPKVLAANKELRDAEATFDKLSVMVKSMEIKKGELDNLVKLKCNGTYVDNMTKPTKNLNAETSSEYLRNSMSRVPTKFED